VPKGKNTTNQSYKIIQFGHLYAKQYSCQYQKDKEDNVIENTTWSLHLDQNTPEEEAVPEEESRVLENEK